MAFIILRDANPKKRQSGKRLGAIYLYVVEMWSKCGRNVVDVYEM